MTSIFSKAESHFSISDSSFNFAKYPTVQFKFWNRAHLSLDTSTVILLENRFIRKINITASEENLGKRLFTNKIIYILIENHYLPKGEKERVFFKQILTTSLQGRILPGDKIYIVTFDWYRNGKYSFLLNQDGSDNEEKILSLINNISKPAPLANQQTGADIYFALDEALEFLSNLNDSLSKNILLLSDDFPNIAAQKTAEEIRDASLKADIPIYAIGYNIGAERYSQLTKTEICNNTNGAYFNSVNNDINACTDALIGFIENMNLNSAGKTYLITYTTDLKRTGKKQHITLQINGKKTIETKVKYPFVIVDWVKSYPLQTIAISVILVVATILLIRLTKNTKEKRKQKELSEKERERQLQNTQNEIEHLKQQKSSVTNNIIIQPGNSEIKNKAEQLAKLMQLKNCYPRVIYDNNGQRGEFIINTPIFTIGRDEMSNSQAIQSPSVSRNHAVIIFDETAQFSIKDLKSTNGVFINGQKLNTAVLNNNDVIKLGDVILKINL